MHIQYVYVQILQWYTIFLFFLSVYIGLEKSCGTDLETYLFTQPYGNCEHLTYFSDGDEPIVTARYVTFLKDLSCVWVHV